MDDERTAGDQKPKAGFAFGFSKKQELKQLSKSAVGETEETEDDGPDYVLSLEDKVIKSLREPKLPKQEYVIPLIKHNKWRGSVDSKGASHKQVKSNDLPEAPNTIDELAAKEIILESKKYNEDWDDRDKVDSSIAIPLLMQNKIPEGFESDDRLDVSLRPDVPDDADYEQIPIEHFGMAMLRGMGWTKDRGVGKNGKAVVPIEAHLRPKGLGLGADRNNSAPDKISVNNKIEDQEKLEMKKNAYCVVTGGAHKGFYGTVEGIDEDNARVMLKLTLSGKIVNIIQCNVNVVGKKEYEKYSKYLNREKADSIKKLEEHKMKNGDDHMYDNDDYRDGKRKSHKRKAHSENDERERNSSSHKSKKSKKSVVYDRSYKSERDSPKDSKNSTTHSKKQMVNHSEEKDELNRESILPWLRNDLKVRVIDKSFQNGRYYKEKVVIVDVPSTGMCVCKTGDNKVISDVPQYCLETVIPRTDDAHVAIVAGDDIGQIGKVMKRDKDRCIALVQLLSDRDIVLRLPYDKICEYVGNVHDRDDF
ncbi:G patch domain and kow motifs-containing protein [Plakobranchus ocellatus]|uniref:G patch domain and kow motifs-containing protein n=1 Tax=Plakobranchus ocellatus TaxID=259542 RepID=A0AAV3Y2B5_9GAST|nr:G patch domain and kow motifs-containing protein [Plakobranchus ocellatus]